MAKYTKRKIKVTAAELQKQFFGGNRRPLPGHEDDFPRWIWPYIRRALLAGKLTKELKVPKGADIKDYPLVVVGFLKKANIDFPGVNIAELPDGFFAAVKEAMDAKRMDQYGKVVSPEVLDDIPSSLWPFVTPGFRLGGLANVKGILSIGTSLDIADKPIKPKPIDKPIIDYPGKLPFPIVPKA